MVCSSPPLISNNIPFRKKVWRRISGFWSPSWLVSHKCIPLRLLSPQIFFTLTPMPYFVDIFIEESKQVFRCLKSMLLKKSICRKFLTRGTAEFRRIVITMNLLNIFCQLIMAFVNEFPKPIVHTFICPNFYRVLLIDFFTWQYFSC